MVSDDEQGHAADAEMAVSRLRRGIFRCFVLIKERNETTAGDAPTVLCVYCNRGQQFEEAAVLAAEDPAGLVRRMLRSPMLAGKAIVSKLLGCTIIERQHYTY